MGVQFSKLVCVSTVAWEIFAVVLQSDNASIASGENERNTVTSSEVAENVTAESSVFSPGMSSSASEEARAGSQSAADPTLEVHVLKF